MRIPSGRLVSCFSTVVALCRLVGTATSVEVQVDAHGNLLPPHASENDDAENSVQCGLWMAPSTIPGAGLGLYAGVDFATDQDLAGHSVAIAVSDLVPHNAHKPHHTSALLLNEYTWAGSALLDPEGVAQVHFISEGVGAVANCLLPLYNVNIWYPRSRSHRHPLHHRSTDPGAGASTTFFRRATARHDIAAGSELFLSYGEEWFVSRTATLGPVPLTDDLDRATELVQALLTLERSLQERTSVNTTAMVADVWQTFVQQTPFRASRVLWGSFQSHESSLSSRDEWHTWRHHGDVTQARRAETVRSVSWLRRHGTCADHVTSGPSVVPHAGHGAFATRRLTAHTVVAALPMIHVPDRDRFEMFALFPNEDNDWNVGEDDTVMGQQLLLNYCYGHAESTMLLCPYGTSSYINHNQSLVNVRLQWASPDQSNHAPHVLNETVDHIRSTYTNAAKLAMELVAIRDIEAGEEIYMDYGDEWETAWQAHLASWEPGPDAAWYVSALQLNEQYDKTVRLRTAYQEDEDQQYPDNVQLRCDISCHMDADAVQTFYENGALDEYLWQRNRPWWLCAVLDSRLDSATGEYLYTVIVKDNDEPFEEYVVPNVPREIVHFVDVPYSSDTFLHNAFRHDIRIPDALFPSSWRNVPKS